MPPKPYHFSKSNLAGTVSGRALTFGEKDSMASEKPMLTRKELQERTDEWNASFRRVRRRGTIAFVAVLVIGMGSMFLWSTEDPPKFLFAAHPWIVMLLAVVVLLCRERSVQNNDVIHAIYCPACKKALAGVVEIAMASRNCGHCGAQIVEEDE